MASEKWFIEQQDKRIKKIMRKNLGLLGEFFNAATNVTTPVDTGFLKGKNGYRIIKGDTWRYSNSADYAPYVALGTGRNAKNRKRNQNIEGQKPQD